MKNQCSAIEVAPEITLYHTGPALDHGPLPALFYFSISGPDSLTLDPYNQPVQFLQGSMIRIFSMTLPGHENDLPAAKAIQVWASDLGKKQNTIATFLDRAETALEFAIRERFVNPEKLAIAGLSRGAFIGMHLAARVEKFHHIVSFAPLTRLKNAKEFHHLKNDPLIHSMDLHHLSEKLGNRHICLFIGNEDTRVGTKDCFELLQTLVQNKKTRQSKTEMHIYPSIGANGHGTPPEIFKQGVDWIKSHLMVK